ncbi:hypothetical protein VTJ04DRAFT_3051 [Mycothermus thermophilus]|uniref:uncharacterized protein n=1 Tax=Humicola insolens TaxID=85995 RepID=UPI003742ACDF
MDRDDEKNKTGEGKPVAGHPSTTTRFTSPLIITSVSRRKSLFSRSKSEDDPSARPTSSGSISENITKIPRPVQRNSFTLSDAYRLAEEEELGQGSPSPAPRSWRSRESIEGGQNLGSKIPGASRSSDNIAGDSAISQQPEDSDSTFDEKLRQFAKDQAGSENLNRRSSGLLSRSRLGSRIVESSKGLLRKSSSNSFENPSPPRSTKTGSDSPSSSFLRRLSMRKRESGDSPSARPSSESEHHGGSEPRNDEASRPSTTPKSERSNLATDARTPNQSFAWQTDADFTGGDLQVSTSPPVGIRRSNTKLDQIRALEAELSRQPVGGSEQEAKDDRENKPHGLEFDAPLDRPRTSPDQQKLRAVDRLSKRLSTAIGLGDPHEKTDGSGSPHDDHGLTLEDEPMQLFSPVRNKLRKRVYGMGSIGENLKETHDFPSSVTDTDPSHSQPAGERSDAIRADNPITDDKKTENTASTEPKEEDLQDGMSRPPTTKGADSTVEVPITVTDPTTAVRDEEPGEQPRKRRSFGFAKSDGKPSVAFASLSRSSSVNSRDGKRSVADSETDPVERIEGEMQLFAPPESQSEKGSLGLPSPVSDGGMLKETPKPTKIDPLTQPTPRVVGAYIDTPATVKVENKPDIPGRDTVVESDDLASSESSSGRPSIQQQVDTTIPAPPGEVRQKKRSLSSKGERGSSRSSSVSARRRARSLSRSRKPLINSAKPPTVKDDLLDIQRTNQIDDSTLDDLAEILNQQEQQAGTSTWKGLKAEIGDDSKADIDAELELMQKLHRQLETGLMGIRSARQGIERLEDKVAHADTNDHEQHKAKTQDPENKEPVPSTSDDDDDTNPPTGGTTTTYLLAFPVLWYREPKLRFTSLGLFLFLLTLWYAAESLMCYQYCRPQFCYPGKPCDWSADDPVWGYAIPIKVDQWVTGGKGRTLATRLRPQVTDWLSDMWDKATGTDPTAVDTSHLTWERKRRHTRRLARKGLVRFPWEQTDGEENSFWSWTSAS